MESAIFTQALKEYLRAKRVLPWLFLSLLCFALSKYWSHLQEGATAAQAYGQVSSIMVFHIEALASAIFTTAIISQEVEQRTIVYLLTRPVPRWKLLVIRYLASALVVFGIGVFGAILTAIGSGDHSLLSKDIVALAVGAFAYGALFLMVSLLFNRAMIICLLYAFGWEISIPSLPGSHVQHPT